MTDIASKIKGIVDGADVVLFMKGVPQAPQCGFSMQVVHILNQVGAPYTAVNVLADGDVPEGIKAFSNWPTIPQLDVKGESSAVATSRAKCFSRGSWRRSSTKKELRVNRV